MIYLNFFYFFVHSAWTQADNDKVGANTKIRHGRIGQSKQRHTTSLNPKNILLKSGSQKKKPYLINFFEKKQNKY